METNAQQYTPGKAYYWPRGKYEASKLPINEIREVLTDSPRYEAFETFQNHGATPTDLAEAGLHIDIQVAYYAWVNGRV